MKSNEALYLNDEYSGSNTYTSENILNVIGEQYVYLMVNNWGGVQVYDIKDNSAYTYVGNP